MQSGSVIHSNKLKGKESSQGVRLQQKGYAPFGKNRRVRRGTASWAPRVSGFKSHLSPFIQTNE